MVGKSDLLIIKGVFPDEFHKKNPVYLDKTQSAPLREYVAIPKVFRCAAEWKKISTSLHCWECGLSISSYPKFVPENPRFENDIDICDVNGAFCEWGCVIRYIQTYIPREQQSDYLQSVSIFESKFSGKYREYIAPNASRLELKKYIGESGLTEAEFREKNIQLANDYQLNTFKIDHLRVKTIDGVDRVQSE